VTNDSAPSSTQAKLTPTEGGLLPAILAAHMTPVIDEGALSFVTTICSSYRVLHINENGGGRIPEDPRLYRACRRWPSSPTRRRAR
jgi:hypothetical protein